MQSMFCKTGVQNPGLLGVLELASAVGFLLRPRKVLCKLVEFCYQWKKLHKILRGLKTSKTLFGIRRSIIRYDYGVLVKRKHINPGSLCSF